MTTTAPARANHKPDAADRALLDALQAGLALERRPYAEVGERIGMPEAEVLERIRRLKDAAIIRQISAIFDTRALGYGSSLVAARYPAERLFDAAKVIGGHPGVSHNYRRTHAFNLWYTLAVAPDAKLSLEETMERLAQETRAESMRLLPTLKLYKINVQLDMEGTRANDAKEETPKPPPGAATAWRRPTPTRRRSRSCSATCPWSRSPSTPGPPRPASPPRSCWSRRGCSSTAPTCAASPRS